MRGFQGDVFGPDSVSTMTKHFPGGGPQEDGEDPHFAYGREQVYPGDQFELHLKPFEAIFAAGGRQMMPYYGMPMGTEHEEVGFGFNKSVLTGLLRERFGFDGIVCTDWGLVNDSEILGQPHPARAWGVEHLTPAERMAKILDAGADQFGGEMCPDLLIELVENGTVSEERLDVSARRLLREKFLLGLFENPFVDAEAADSIVGSAEFRAVGDAAQRESITVLTNEITDAGAAGAPVRPGREALRRGPVVRVGGEVRSRGGRHRRRRTSRSSGCRRRTSSARRTSRTSSTPGRSTSRPRSSPTSPRCPRRCRRSSTCSSIDRRSSSRSSSRPPRSSRTGA